MLPAVKFDELTANGEEEPSLAVLARVLAARARQRERMEDARMEDAALWAPPGKETVGASREGATWLNAQLDTKTMERVCELDASGTRLLRASMEKLGLSARAYHRILRVSRTIADLEGERRIRSHHVAEAVHYRALDRSVVGG